MKIMLVGVFSLMAGISLAVLSGPVSQFAVPSSELSVDNTAAAESDIELRLLALENALSIEQNARQQTAELGDQLRQQLGDAGYERYLTANGRPLHVSISSVLDSSPAQSAGLPARRG